MAPLLFLDMDDVLVLDARYTSYQVRQAFLQGDMGWQALWDGVVDAGARANLRRLHDEFGPTYVISSCWTIFLRCAQFHEVFHRTGLSFVAGHLHAEWATPKAPGQPRVEDVWRWCQRHRAPGQAMLALDDTESGWSLGGSHFDAAGQVVLCDTGEGLTDAKLAQAQQLLRAQLAASLENRTTR
jgi:hypothetical protein